MNAPLDDLASRGQDLRERIAVACRQAGRRSSEIRVVAVSKQHPRHAVEAAVAQGWTDFGENYVQEAIEKFPVPGARLHFVGALQRNKIRRILPLCHLVQGVASVSVLEAIDRIATEESRRVDVLLQLHLTDEPSKSGFGPHEMDAVLDLALRLGAVRVGGFMTMAPLQGGEDAARRTFASARAVRDRALRVLPGATELSMGMSGDFETAIAEGATLVRVGTALFGRRDAP